MSRRSLKFTLAELLTVIVICGILASLGIAAAVLVRARSRRAACAGNLRQVGQLLHLYLEGNNFRMPYCTVYPADPPDNEKSFPGIAEVLCPDGRGREILRCPGDRAGYFERHSSSYEWNSIGVNGRQVESKNFTVFGFQYPVMYDYDVFHAPLRNNYLYIDGQVTDEPLQRH